jgi:hypothetical protein
MHLDLPLATSLGSLSLELGSTLFPMEPALAGKLQSAVKVVVAA